MMNPEIKARHLPHGRRVLMMNPEIKARWTAWLRANADKQTTGNLNRVVSFDEDHPVGFCCLGGLCELAVEDGIISSREVGDIGQVINYGTGESDWSMSTLPQAVWMWAGLHNSDPIVRVAAHPDEDETETHSLTELNDDYRFDFHQIADLIDAQL